MTARNWFLVILVFASMNSFAAEPAEFTAQGFVDQVGQEALTGGALGTLALKKSATPEVHDYARRMIALQERMIPGLAALAKARGLEAPAKLDSMHQALVMAVDTEEGDSFDHVYARQMNSGRERTIELCEGAAESADADLARFAQEILPLLKQDRALAKRLTKMSR